MPTASDIRAWARDNGHDVPDRGNIPTTIRALYDAAHPHPNGTADTSHPDYPDDDFETAFIDPPDDDGEAFDESVMAEEKPRRPKAGNSRRGNSSTNPGKTRFWQRGSKAGAGSKAKKRPRVSTEDMLGGAWRLMAKIATPLPPLNRTLRIQAPVAGMLLEDVVKDTAADTFLQPLARLAGQGKVVSALLGPPVIVTALMMHVQQRAQMQPPQEPNPFFICAGTEALRSSLMTWAELTEGKILIAAKREADMEARFGQSVDELIAFLLSPPAATAEAVAAEEEAIRRAQGLVVDA
jgi:hypothetical protein